KGSPIFFETARLRPLVFAFVCGAGLLFAASDETSAGEAEGFAPSLSDAETFVAFARELSEAAAFPKADTAFPKTRNAERQVAHRAAEPLRAGLKKRVCLGMFST